MTFYPIRSKSDHIRNIPFPYKGILTISNDIEFFAFKEFESFMEYVNTNHDTVIGKGLGLEITSSVFFYSDQSYNFSYFDGYDVAAQRSIYADRILEYIRSGWIDTLHAYGDFDATGSFERAHATRIFKELKQQDASIGIFTNHGGPNNIQNIGKDALYHEGDKVSSVAYHSDMFKENGVEFVWTDSLKDKDDIQNSGLRNQVIQFAKRIFFLVFPFTSIKIGKKVISKDVIPKEYKNKELLPQLSLNDGQKITGFRRLDIPNLKLGIPTNVGPNFSTLDDQLRQIDWNEFYQKNGGVVVYQHLGVLHKSEKLVPTSMEALQSKPEYLEPLRFLAEERDKSQLMVLGTYRFLTYAEMIQNTEVDIDESDKKITIQNKNSAHVMNPVVFFQGLTIYVNTPSEYGIYYQGQKLDCIVNDIDETGKPSLTVNLLRLQSIW